MSRNKDRTLQLRIDASLLNMVKQLADTQGKTVSGVIRELLVIWIKAVKAEEKKHPKGVSHSWLTSFFEEPSG